MSVGFRAFRWLPTIVATLIESARANRMGNKRSPRRARLSRPAMVILENGERLFASSRNISKGGIGLSHECELPVGNVRINVDLGGGRYMHVRARLLWCRRGDDNSCISGAQFLSAPIMCTPTGRSDSEVAHPAVA
jgi:hypothetical protein